MVAASRPLHSRVSGFLQRNWFTLALPCVGYFSYTQPGVLRTEGLISYEKLKDPSVAGIFFASGLTMPMDHMTRMVRAWRHHCVVLFLCFGVMPALFVATSPVLRDLGGLPDPVISGWKMFACLPTSVGVALALTRMGNGNVALTMVNTAISSTTGVVLTPFLIEQLSGVRPTIDSLAVIGSMLSLVALPAVAGVVARSAVSAIPKMDPVTKLVPQMLLLPLLGNVFSNAAHRRNTDPDGDPTSVLSAQQLSILALASVSANGVMLGTSYAFTRMIGFTKMDRVAIAIMASQKTAAMGIPLMSVMFDGDPTLPMLMLPLLIYHPIQAGIGGAFAMGITRVRF